MTTAVIGEATAIGEDTFTTAEVYVQVVNHGKVTISRAKAVFKAVAESPDGGVASSTTDVMASVPDADLVVTQTTNSIATFGDLSWSGSATKMRLFAIDIEGIDLSNSVVIERTTMTDQSLEGEIVDGNFAELQLDAQAVGDETYLSVDATLLTIEDAVSEITLSVIAAADSFW